MSAAHRSLARLPRTVFDDLVAASLLDENFGNAAILRDGSLLQKSICDKLQATKVKTVRDFFLLSNTNLLHVLDPLLTYDECFELRHRIAHHCAASSTNALELLQQQGFLSESKTDEEGSPSMSSPSNHAVNCISTGLLRLDQQFTPFQGLPLGSITEIVGIAGAGKSQMANQLCLQAIQQRQQHDEEPQSPNNAPFSYAIYIDTEGKASQQRLHEMARLRQHQQYPQNLDLNRILFYKPESTQELMESTLSQVEADMYEHPVRLVILDSIAAPLRRDPHLSAQYRTNAALHIAQTLKRLAHELNVAVVVINQVGAVFSHSDDDRKRINNKDLDQPNGHPSSVPLLPQQLHSSSVKAALGTAWYHCVSTRILLEQQQTPLAPADKMDHLDIVHRTATIVKSNIVQTPSQVVDFVISGLGLVPVEQ